MPWWTKKFIDSCADDLKQVAALHLIPAGVGSVGKDDGPNNDPIEPTALHKGFLRIRAGQDDEAGILEMD
jgi:hypothetical protein